MAPFVRRERKHRNRTRDSIRSSAQNDSNVVELVPADQAARRLKFEQARDELRAQQPRISSKKKKRLDKYIENKLRHEENIDLLKKLDGHAFDTSLLQRSANLGKTTATRKSIRELVLQDPTETGESEERSPSPVSEPADESQSSKYLVAPLPLEHSPTESSEGESHEPSAPDARYLAIASTAKLGGGLKRPLEVDAYGNPIIKKRQRFAPSAKPDLDDAASWDGFTSEGDTEGSTAGEGESDPETSDELDSIDTSSSDTDFVEPKPMALFSIVTRSAPQVSKPRPGTRADPEFKAWATHEINKARDFQPSNALSDISNHLMPPQPPKEPAKELKEVPKSSNSGDVSNIERSKRSEGEAPKQQSILPNGKDLLPRKAHSVLVERNPAIEKTRMELPVVAEEQTIMEAIHNNPITIISGATGSGKSTQLPQFLYEAGYGNPESPLTPGLIGITQPRRVAVLNVSKRVGQELGRKEVSSYQIRFDTSLSRQTAIKFMTDGILIREISQDFALNKYSVLIIDEAHERSVNTDLLIGMLTRIVDLRATLHSEDPRIKPLKLIIMSATLGGSFLENNLFRNGIPPKVVECEGRQFSVTIHFARQTRADYVEDAFRKIIKGHRQLPPGGMLVFLTGQNEIQYLMKKLKEKLSTSQDVNSSLDTSEDPLNGINSDLYQDQSDDEKEFVVEDDRTAASSKALLLPLYSQLPTKEQLRVFEPVPDNTRLIILATNVAETSITIPGIRYVIDTGRRKEKVYNEFSGVQSFPVGWINKSSAQQRAGRAGRNQPGHCYRLFSSAVFERDFEEHTQPEILRTPLESVVLQLKSMDLQNIANFPFPTPPDRSALLKAEMLLSNLGAIDRDGKITSIGKELSVYPLSPRLAKMLAIGQQECIYHMIALVAALAVPDIFVPESQPDLNPVEERGEGEIYSNSDRIQDSIREQRRKDYDKVHYQFGAPADKSDAIKLLIAFGEYLWTSSTSDDLEAYCTSKFLRSKALKEAKNLYHQLSGIVASHQPGTFDLQKSTALPPPSKKQIAILKQIVATGFIDNVAIRADLAPNPPEIPRHPKRAIDTPYLPLSPIHSGRPKSLEELAVFIHPSSILSRSSPKDLPQYIIYSTLQQSAPSTIASDKIPKTRMHPLTAVSGKVLFALAKSTPLVEYGKPLGKVEEVEGERNLRVAWVVPSLIGGVGREWPLPAVKVRQRRDERGRWEVERMES